MVVALFGKSKKKIPPAGPPRNVSWVTSAKGQYYNFLNLEVEDLDLSGASGVFVIWLGGRWPEWLFIGRSNNLAKSLREHQSSRDILAYAKESPLFATWAEIRPEFQDGVVQYLNQVIPPTIANPTRRKKTNPPSPSSRPVWRRRRKNHNRLPISLYPPRPRPIWRIRPWFPRWAGRRRGQGGLPEFSV
jgi:hypothetical protein